MCKKIRKGKPLPCDECVPPLWPVNAEAARIFMACHRQVVMGPGERIVDIQHGPVHGAMALYQVSDPIDCFEKVCLLAREIIVTRDEE